VADTKIGRSGCLLTHFFFHLALLFFHQTAAAGICEMASGHVFSTEREHHVFMAEDSEFAIMNYKSSSTC